MNRPPLWPLTPVYRLALLLREAELRTGLRPVRRLRWPVVSVGNLSAGGAGKTPLVIALARALAARGAHVDVLSRGYGRRRSALPLGVDPNGAAEEFGDEPLVIARAAGVPVFVADERYAAGLLAEANASPCEAPQVGEPANPPLRVHLLDDGFQHRQLARDVEILLLSRRDLAERLLPAGNLREALHAAARASVFAIPEDEPEVAEWVRSQGWERPVWRLRRRMDAPSIEGPVVAFCGIARPEQFFRGLEQAGMRPVARLAFADHHRYTGTDLKRITAAARAAGAVALVTTEKDRARLGARAESLAERIPLEVVPLRMEIEDEAAAIDWLLQRIRACARHS